MEEDASGTAQGRKKQAFSAKEHGLEATGTFNIIMDTGCEGNNTPSILRASRERSERVVK